MKRANEKKKKRANVLKWVIRCLTHISCKISCVVVYTHLLCTTHNKLCSCVLCTTSVNYCYLLEHSNGFDIDAVQEL